MNFLYIVLFQLICTTLFLNKPFIILLRFPSSVVFKTLTNTYLHNSKVYPLHFASELKVRNNKHHCPSLSPLMWASCWLGWPSFPAIPPSILMPRFKENMGNGYKNTSNLQSNIYQINYPICTQAKHQLKSKVKELCYIHTLIYSIQVNCILQQFYLQVVQNVFT